jgi:glycosyltransferase involved in cell wall biosynthesis
MAVVRIHLITFRRPALLPRAIRSLRDQTFRDWICDVQNGDPEDPGPGRLLDSLNDSRFRLFLPPRRIGPVEAFNLAHRPAAEPYQSLLEDDNWWEPGFLETMLAALAAHPEAGLAWSNMRTWREREDGGWDDTGLPVWNLPAGSPPRLFFWPHLIQFGDSLYSNGSMLLRSQLAAKLMMPPATPRDMFEQAREHLMDFPILLVPDLLANFALTRQTLRSTDYSGWSETQALLGAAFLARVPMADPARAALWAHRRRLRPRSTNGLIYAGLLQRDLKFLRHATLADWAAFARGAARRPGTTWRVLRAKRRLAGTWRWLDATTAARTAEARRRGFVALAEDSLIDKKARS